jgi:uncharacterized protein (TIGR02757 family)
MPLLGGARPGGGPGGKWPCLEETLESLYETYNRPEWISPDPVECVRPYENPLDREIAGLVASGLAYGRVRQIMKSVRKVLGEMGTSPRVYLERSSRSSLERDFSSFRHRFTPAEDLVSLLTGILELCRIHGSLENAFLAGGPAGENYIPNLETFLRELGEASGAGGKNSLLCLPSGGSACKRHWLFLKWMVRSDAVDPGGWGRCDPARILIPLDTHMYRIGRALGFTRRKTADLKAALEVTRGFSALVPEDPARYDFVLTRFGIRDDLRVEDLLAQCGPAAVDIHAPEDGHAGQEEQG